MFMARVYASVKQVDSNWACKNRNCKAEALFTVWTPVPGANDARAKAKNLGCESGDCTPTRLWYGFGLSLARED
jgi:hypothetical protein